MERNRPGDRRALYFKNKLKHYKNMADKGKYIAVIEIVVPASNDKKAEEVAKLLADKLDAYAPKLSEVYFEQGQNRRLIYNE